MGCTHHSAAASGAPLLVRRFFFSDHGAVVGAPLLGPGQVKPEEQSTGHRAVSGNLGSLFSRCLVGEKIKKKKGLHSKAGFSSS
jgi:hypothetical protein